MNKGTAWQMVVAHQNGHEWGAEVESHCDGLDLILETRSSDNDLAKSDLKLIRFTSHSGYVFDYLNDGYEDAPTS